MSEHSSSRNGGRLINLRAGRIHSGARQVRAVGRLALYRKYRTFWASMSTKLQLAKIAEIQRAEDAGYAVIRETGLRQIYIVSSVCGGTGAGMLLDIAHRVRETRRRTRHDYWYPTDALCLSRRHT
ncbi:MAG: hypothetical protein IPO15_00020 [Anaerolineae bacterium]|nr:hypothetical protein [Anaerolineae bacterium]